MLSANIGGAIRWETHVHVHSFYEVRPSRPELGAARGYMPKFQIKNAKAAARKDHQIEGRRESEQDKCRQPQETRNKRPFQT